MVQVLVGPLIVGVMLGVRVIVGEIVRVGVIVKVGVLHKNVTETVLLVTGPPPFQVAIPALEITAQGLLVQLP